MSYPYYQEPESIALQRRYSSQLVDQDDLNSPTSPSNHERFSSSADLYALDAGQAGHSRNSMQGGARRSGSDQLLSSWHNDSDSSEDDDSPGFGRVPDEPSRSRRSSAQVPFAGQGQRQAKRGSRMSMQAPPLIASLSSQSTLPPPAHFGHAQHPSTTSLGPYGLPYSDSAPYNPATASSASFGKFPTTPAAGDTVDAPILSKQDWNRGEAIREKNVHEKGKAREKREAAAGVLGDLGYWIRRRWKWLLPVFILLCVAAIVLCYFLIPRTPTITFTSTKVPANPFTSTDTDPYVSAKDPTAFSFDGSLTFALDASASYLPVTYKSFGLRVKLSDTGGTISHTVWGGGEIKVKARGVTSYEFPITFQGNYTDDNDRTYQAMRSACAHKYATIYRPPLNLTVEVEAAITGVVNPPKRVATLRGVDCPIEWLANAS
ncbi:hypothetical protein JCM8547_007177 [Rhodosporidiobolus lusitaniae]